jgi:hypothetical protein
LYVLKLSLQKYYEYKGCTREYNPDFKGSYISIWEIKTSTFTQFCSIQNYINDTSEATGFSLYAYTATG